MAACNLMEQKRVYEYFIPLKYFYLTVDTMLNSYKTFGIEIVLQTCFCTAGRAIYIAMLAV